MRKMNSLFFFFLIILVIFISGCSDPVTENENILIDKNEDGKFRSVEDLAISWRTMSDTSSTPI